MPGTRRLGGLLALALGTSALALVACNAIIGVQDVQLMSDAGDSEQDDDADAPPEDRDSTTPARENVLNVALGESHSCARKTDGTVKCWGNDQYGQTGTGGDSDGGVVDQPHAVNISDAIAIAAGKSHTCVAREGGKVSCWGYNLDGQLGNGQSATSSPSPVDVAGLTGVTAVAAGSNFSCALRSGGSIACWGANGSGQLGTNDESPRTTPASVVNLKSIVSIAAGDFHACAVKSDGSVSCWGDGINGQLGAPSTQRSSSPVAVTPLPPAAAVVAGSQFTCALMRDKNVYCWGANVSGQLGNGTKSDTGNATPAAVKNLNDAKSVWAGANHACAARESGSIVCWGEGKDGQLGDGVMRPQESTAQPSVVPVSGVANAIGGGGGASHSCAATKANTIMCWGANDSAQLGTGATSAGEFAPVNVVGL